MSGTHQAYGAGSSRACVTMPRRPVTSACYATPGTTRLALAMQCPVLTYPCLATRPTRSVQDIAGSILSRCCRWRCETARRRAADATTVCAAPVEDLAGACQSFGEVCCGRSEAMRRGCDGDGGSILRWCPRPRLDECMTA
eukprot:640092-Rhodomonas_salina.5